MNKTTISMEVMKVEKKDDCHLDNGEKPVEIQRMIVGDHRSARNPAIVCDCQAPASFLACSSSFN